MSAVGLVLSIVDGTRTKDRSEPNIREGTLPVAGEFDSSGAAEIATEKGGELYMR